VSRDSGSRRWPECPGITESRQHHRVIPPRVYELHGIPETALEKTQDDKPDGAGQ
jgi:hypothetical protein